ncbi:complement receptor type 1 isoform X2 [Gasterosteus aculeatus]|uniref:complement receptor type 1-like isoform X2 n=1 Tax=Gasterosteus aculeatus aculeatus TaxID=481459 RepID=UPI001A995749|nr:complement receptor type 1-like isoform X2 [Gasterosteus aculeatus aculeatus]
MRDVARIFLLLSFALLASALGQVPEDCSAPPEFPHTRLLKKYTGTRKFSSGEKVRYGCREDSAPSAGSTAVRCDAGRWSQLTLKCAKISCGNAGELPHGEFQYEGDTVVGERVYAVCREGYTLKGLNYMTCKTSGWTGEFPTCVEGETTCSPPAVAHSANRTGEVPVHRAGDHLTFSCAPGFQLDGAQRITCGPDGLWRPPAPRCLPLPDETRSPDGGGRCGVPVTGRHSNAELADRYLGTASFASGDRVHYACGVGHAQAGGSRYRTCVAGKWTPLLLKCERKLCGSAGEILNGQFEYSGVMFGDKATAVCDEGHRLVGQATRYCLSGGWDGRVPVCEAVACEEPPEETNAVMMDPQESGYTYSSVIRYQCRVGTPIGKRNIWCTKDGTWSDPPPKCKVITCPDPNVPHAYWRGRRYKLFQDRDSVVIHCYPGYRKTGPRAVTCGANGWSPGLPKCNRFSRK